MKLRYQDFRNEEVKHVTFDFRYYLNYYYKETEEDRDGGLYIFKSTVNESLPFNHTVSSVTSFQGSIMSMFLIAYNGTMNPYQQTSVKIKLPVLMDPSLFPDQVEFDVYLEGIEYMPGIDVTVNWKCQELESRGLFFTDSNGLDIVRRHADDYS